MKISKTEAGVLSVRQTGRKCVLAQRADTHYSGGLGMVLVLQSTVTVVKAQLSLGPVLGCQIMFSKVSNV